MTLPNSIVFLVDVDNTLIDNDRIQDDIKRHLDREFGRCLPRAVLDDSRAVVY